MENHQLTVSAVPWKSVMASTSASGWFRFSAVCNCVNCWHRRLIADELMREIIIIIIDKFVTCLLQLKNQTWLWFNWDGYVCTTWMKGRNSARGCVHLQCAMEWDVIMSRCCFYTVGLVTYRAYGLWKLLLRELFKGPSLETLWRIQSNQEEMQRNWRFKPNVTLVLKIVLFNRWR